MSLNSNDKFGIIFTSILYIILATIVYISFNYNNEEVTVTLSLTFVLMLLVFAVEASELAVLSTIRWKPLLQIFLVGKEILTSFLITLISLLIVLSSLSYFNVNYITTKNTFNLIVITTFILALLIYSLYTMLNIPGRLDKISSKIIKVELISNTELKKSLNKSEIINIVDLIIILATVFLLGNSTVSSLDMNSKEATENFFDSTEFKMLFIVMAIYVQGAFYRLPIKQNKIN